MELGKYNREIGYSQLDISKHWEMEFPHWGISKDNKCCCFEKKNRRREFDWIFSTLLVTFLLMIFYAFIITGMENAGITVNENSSLAHHTRSNHIFFLYLFTHSSIFTFFNILYGEKDQWQ